MATLFAARSGKLPISRKTWRKLEQAESAAGLRVEEPPGIYRKSATLGHGPIPDEKALDSRMLNAAYQPVGQPTRAQIEEHFRRYLDAAERAPGGLGFAWIQIKKHFKPQDFEDAGEE